MTSFSIVDTHTHLYDPVFDEDRSDVLKQAQNAGISGIISVSESLSDAVCNLKLADQYPIIKPAAGLYPAHLDLTEAEAMVEFIRANRESLVAIGEVGLDFWIAKEASQRDIQKTIFKTFISLSKELKIPLNVHSRSAGRVVIEMLLQENAEQVHLHAFDGKAVKALPAVEAGYYFSIPPSIVRSRQKQKLVKQLPMSCVLLETDSPVLGPVQGERNVPVNIACSIEAIAGLKNVSEKEVIETTYANTLKLYAKNWE